ncbi:chaperone protein dnaJ 8, chloroplastic-like [Zingiber officinale]|uniref:J domain-containing protein n=1 Tax=Zingiber officinale TaxID=94328 RepID=A0A8J5G8Q8_ZINOF|nr:chaperone protein dnaJ 8, chloroplastic-like [Zingiber officinale]KAG6502281.1 hypothetical protein ZIOFF_042170 [Zingiber officinale]
MATGMLRSASAASPIGGRIERRSRGGRRCAGEVRCAASMSGSLANQYRTLRIQPGASENEVKKAFRQLALQYHPDVCKESNCSAQFQQIYEAYDILMTKFIQGEEDQTPKAKKPNKRDYDGLDEPFRGKHDPSWDMWEEWMGWEGAGIRDYSSHINPYI